MLRTEPLTEEPALSWSMGNESLQVPLRGEPFRLEVKCRDLENGHESSLGHLELHSDELLARCLQGDAAALFNVSTEQQGPTAEMKLEFLLVPDEELEAGSRGDVPGNHGLMTELDHRYNIAIQLADTDAEKWFILMTIAAQYYEQFRQFQDTLSLAKALSPFEEAIGLVLDITPPQVDQLQFIRDKTKIYVTGMSEFVAAFREFNATALDCLSGMLRRSSAVYNMLYDRFRVREDLSMAISLCEQARSLVPEHHPDTPLHRRQRGVALTLRFRLANDVQDINESIASLEDSVRLTEESDIDLPDKLTNLGTAYVLRAEYSHSLSDVNKAIVKHTKALTLREDYTLLQNLATAVLLRFIFQRDLTDAEAAVVTLERAVRLVPDGHDLELQRCLGNLGVAYHNRFEVLHRLEDIDNAVATQQRAFRISEKTGDDNPERAIHAASLGNAYLSRAETLYDADDVHLAVETLKRAVELTPPGVAYLHTRRYNLGCAYARRYDFLHDSSDVDHAIVEFDASLGLLPEMHANRPAVLSELASALQARFEVAPETRMEDIDRAIRLSLDALSSLDTGDYRRGAVLTTLATSHLSRFRALLDPCDIDEAIRRYEQVMDLVPAGTEDPGKQCAAMQLAHATKQRHEFRNSSDDLDAAITNYRIAATTPNGVPWSSFLAAKSWAHSASARGDDPTDILKAYGTAIELLPRVGWIGHAVADRHAQLVAVGSSLIAEAVASAIAQGEHCLAIEWLDQARAIVWGQLLKLRTSFDELRTAAPALADNLDRVSRALDTAGSRDVVPTTDFLGTARLKDVAQEGRRTSVEWQRWRRLLEQLTGLSRVLDSIGASLEVVTDTEFRAQEQHRRAEEWDQLVAQAREIPGFENFLRPRSFPQIMEALHCSPVVVVNASQKRCDALVLMEGLDGVVHIPLESLTFDRAQHLRKGLIRLLSDYYPQQRTTRGAGMVPIDPSVRGMGDILRELWERVVKPILDSLAFSIAEGGSSDMQRIWWCPTGPLTSLPLHAAGVYTVDEPGNKLSDFAISSYTPTLTPFMHSSSSSSPEGFHGILCISQAQTLPNADAESRLIGEIASEHNVAWRALRDDNGVVQAVLDGLEHYGWAHLACHGVQDIQEPTKSHFVLHDGPLALLEVVAASFKHADFAFLSACQTATGSDKLPDEAAHLAAGMLAAGFKSVIGTMWSIRDEDAPIVAEHVYRHLLSDTAPPDSSRAAMALHRAVNVLREQDDKKTFSWVPFIHVGW
ncbi:hypothetical protein DAEQUDRAFT_769885 [Daedalea quercina L-15889]|uniref:CHAT domain-containing protein n=1 Tax=Daedalea quercina L-15889 TaxID=1314783 RepID=A0A165LC83_9APHY|nr:hypothetical protein DAEQUDRAFT_769885 [Daedalea quercina L-15889]